jgi:hypothetical protein
LADASHLLTVIARDSSTIIYIQNEDGFLIEAKAGQLVTRLHPGKYVLHFGIARTKVDIELNSEMEVCE